MTESNDPYAALLLTEKYRPRARLNTNQSATATVVPAPSAAEEPTRSRGAVRKRR
jgi:hypothetical protein